jgi:Zn-finger nucleic acid-binding protein
MNRIPFGGEIRFITLSEVCPVCDAERGQRHAYGCFAEECPQCHCVLMTCHCRVIKPHESQRHIQAIAESFNNQDEVEDILTAPIIHDVPSMLFVAGWVSVMEFMGIEPEKYDDLGDPMYSAKAVRSIFGESAHVL